jgi:hypothetical protein
MYLLTSEEISLIVTGNTRILSVPHLNINTYKTNFSVFYVRRKFCLTLRKERRLRTKFRRNTSHPFYAEDRLSGLL